MALWLCKVNRLHPPLWCEVCVGGGRLSYGFSLFVCLEERGLFRKEGTYTCLQETGIVVCGYWTRQKSKSFSSPVSVMTITTFVWTINQQFLCAMENWLEQGMLRVESGFGGGKRVWVSTASPCVRSESWEKTGTESKLFRTVKIHEMTRSRDVEKKAELMYRELNNKLGWQNGGFKLDFTGLLRNLLVYHVVWVTGLRLFSIHIFMLKKAPVRYCLL